MELHFRYTVVDKLSDIRSVMTSICFVRNTIERKIRRKTAAVKYGKEIPVVVTERIPLQYRRSNRNAAVESGYVFVLLESSCRQTGIMPREHDRYFYRLSSSLLNNPTLGSYVRVV
jgi:hypothetical protein